MGLLYRRALVSRRLVLQVQEIRRSERRFYCLDVVFAKNRRLEESAGKRIHAQSVQRLQLDL